MQNNRGGILALLFIIAAVVRAEPRWSQSVQYKNQHDPVSIVTLEEKTYGVKYSPKSWKMVAGWERGTELLLVYSSDGGAALVEKHSQTKLPLVHWPEKGHPLS